ncbi:MAG: Eco57I restriction-modification methylase domain-containing protein, partial [Candidatus Poribacteria bacterium]|nr:Eco57I restriction-modification methylase domain-containing protein [Candidatus Poribacteria bacterium]
MRAGDADKVAKWNPYDQNASANWFDSEWMFGITDGFDVVIGNPPYIKEYTFRQAFEGLRESPYYQGKMDIWYLFACEGLDIAKNGKGLVTFIAQNNWVTSFGASKMRAKVVGDAQVLSLIDFGNFKIFESGIQTMIMIFQKNNDAQSYTFDYRRLHGSSININDVESLLNRQNNSKAEYLNPTIKRSDFIDKPLTFSNLEIELILKRISSKHNFRLNPNKEVAQGIVCP